MKKLDLEIASPVRISESMNCYSKSSMHFIDGFKSGPYF